ncbi:head-tail connector protein [Bacillus smithii]|uniref:head-tail connector protein n=1 Tax=Bacillus smithii TaxID=1479 RepID=UPI002E231A3C|nr:head-tail connector protein [Bacillus smithii]MED1456652.1 head-tail connector protein [Bacillus smithii]
MIDEIKLALRIDGTEDDDRLVSLISAAETEIKNSTGVVVDENDPFHRSVVTLLVMKYYDLDMAEQLKPIIENMLIQLQYCSGETNESE